MEGRKGEQGFPYVKILLLFLIVLVLFLFGVIFVLGVVMLKQKGSIETKKYQVLQVDNDNDNKVMFVGSGSSFENIEVNDFLYCNNEERSTSTIISNFGSKEYECEGSCVCSERRSSGVLRSGIRVLVASVSSFLAYNVAKNELEKDCIQKYSDSCHTGSIQVEVDDCHVMLLDVGPSRVDKMFKPDYSKAKTPEEAYNPGMYKCHGHCIPQGYLRENKEIHEMCKELELEGVLKSDSLNEAVEDFIDDSLNLYCVQNSGWDKRYGTSLRVYCVGKYDFINESVTCKKISEIVEEKEGE